MLNVETRFLTNDMIDSLFVFGTDENFNLDNVNVNDIFKPSLIEYYNNDVENW